MRKGHSIIGLKVVAQDNGDDLGAVRDLIFDHEADECVGLLMDAGGLFRDKQIVAWDAIAAMGPDAIMVRSSASKIAAGDAPRLKELMERDTVLSGTHIYTDDGRDLGTFGDVYLDETTGRVVGYELSDGLVSDTMSGKRYLPAEHVLKVGNDVMMVPAAVAGVLEAQAENKPGGLKGVAQAAGEKVGGAYDAARGKASAVYGNIAEASVEQQKEFVVGKTAGRAVFVPQRFASTALAGVQSTLATPAGLVPVSPAVTAVLDVNASPPTRLGEPSSAPEGEAILVRQGETISAQHAATAASAGRLGQLVLAAGGGTFGQATAAGQEKLSGVAASASGSTQATGASLEQSAEDAAIGKPAGKEVLLPSGSTLVASGQTITRAMLDEADRHGKKAELIAAAGLGAASQGAQNTASAVQKKAGGLWETIKEKTAELTGAAGEKKEEFDAAREQAAINNALGRPVTRVILAQDDAVILNTGDLITHKAIDHARTEGVLEVLLDSAYTAEPEITPEMLRAQGKGGAALPSQQEPTGAPITATVTPDVPPQSTPSQGAVPQGETLKF